ncbi:MAG: hypothetical protein K2Q06_10245, partial [Parvularculaceae bacterium]|nr:hypothetical protein [Parvularculaceae bacterium]
MIRYLRHIVAGCSALLLSVSGSGFALAADTPAAAYSDPLKDPYFATPYIDVDEERETPTKHRYVHGGFKGTETRFSFYFPPKEKYQGRFFQHITPVPDSENLAQTAAPAEDDKISAAFAGGAYFVETNGGGRFDLGGNPGMLADPTITAYRANAASAEYSRVVALKIYGGKRPYGYAYGGSGGAYRTIGSFENTSGVWDGVVPYVLGSNMAIPNMFTWRMRTMRVLGEKLDKVVDAAAPGGSGDIYAGLTPLETEVLREATKMGFKPEAWFGWRTMGVHGFAALYGGVVAADPGYFTDFWTKPGYLGHDDPKQFEGARLQFPAKVAGIVTAADAARARINIDASSGRSRGGVDDAFKIPEGAEGARIVGFKLDETPPNIAFLGGDLRVESGGAKGKRLALARIVGDVIVLGFADARVASEIKPGDRVVVDNSNFLAMETYHRHQIPDASYRVWDQFRNADGAPKYPQRPFLLGPLFVKNTAGSILGGQWRSGKMIVVASLWDREALPWQADWYRRLVRQHQGETADENFRLWYTDHALHGDSRAQTSEDPSRIVSYVPVLHQALRDLARWVETGTPAPASTNYEIKDGQVIVAPTAAMRGGVQPVVTLTVHGGTRAS